MARPIAITSLPPSPDEERRRRIRQYTIAMGMRVVCILVAFATSGWVQIACIVGAVVLPSIAVVIANAKRSAPAARHERPGPAGISSGPSQWS